MSATNGKAVQKFGGRRIHNYSRPNGMYLWHPALRDGHFTFRDVPAMLQDDAVKIGLTAIYGPIKSAKFEVKANDKDIKTFVENTIFRFWHHDLQKVLNHYVPWGTAGCEVMYEPDPDTGLWRYGGMDDFSFYDLQPMRHPHSRHITGVRVNSNGSLTSNQVIGQIYGNQGSQWNMLRHPKIFWCAHRPMCGEPFGYSALQSAWPSWQEKRGQNGAVSVRRLWGHNNAFRGCIVEFPPGFTEYNGRNVANQEIAMEIAQTLATGGVVVLPCTTDENGKNLWRITDPKQNGSMSELMEYPTDLNREIWQGMDVPDEVMHAPDVGALFGSQTATVSGPMVIWLAAIDLRVSELITAFDVGPSGYTTRNEQAGGVIRSLVMENFGAAARYLITPISLMPKPAEPGAGGTGGDPRNEQQQTGGNLPPVKLSTADEGVDIPDDEIAAILGDISLSSGQTHGLFDAEVHPKDDIGRFTHKPIKAEHIASAKKALKAGKLAIKTSDEPITSDASGEQIHRHVTLESGQRVHPDELHRLKVEGGEGVLHHDEGLEIHDHPHARPQVVKSFGEALHRIGAMGHDDDPVTLVSRHGYSATRPRSEWKDHEHDGGTFSQWYDKEGHEHTGRRVVEHQAKVTQANEDETANFFAPRGGGEDRLKFSAGDEGTSGGRTHRQFGEDAAYHFNAGVDQVHRKHRAGEDHHEALQRHHDNFVRRAGGSIVKAWNETASKIIAKHGDTPAVHQLLAQKREHVRERLQAVKDAAHERMQHPEHDAGKDDRISGRRDVHHAIHRAHDEIEHAHEYVASQHQSTSRGQELHQAAHLARKLNKTGHAPSAEDHAEAAKLHGKFATLKHDPSTGHWEIHSPGNEHGTHLRATEDGMQMHDNETKKPTSPAEIRRKKETAGQSVSMSMNEAEPEDIDSVSLSSGDDGRWITIGGQVGEDGQRHGGSPVFIRNGKIEKGHPSLAGKKISNLHGPSEHAWDDKSHLERTDLTNKQKGGITAHHTHQQRHHEAMYRRAVHAKKAREEHGINSKHLHQLAAEMMAHDKQFATHIGQVIDEAKQTLEKNGVPMRDFARRHEVSDHTQIPGFDLVARQMAHNHPEIFGNAGYEHQGEGQDQQQAAQEKLFDMLKTGKPLPMSEDDAYRQALDYLVERKQAEPTRQVARSDDPIPFSMAHDDFLECD